MGFSQTKFVDVHTHLTHKAFEQDCSQVIIRAIEAGLGAIVVNGLEPNSNRQVLELSAQYSEVKAAMGIYPVDGVNSDLPSDFPFEVKRFNVAEEIAFIKSQALKGHLLAIGECGLDGHWLPEETYNKQEAVFEALIEIALDADLPLIIHTRKLEKRSMEILRHHKVKRVNFHCFGGRSKVAIKAAEEDGWYFSIPANANVNQAFQKMLKLLPEDKILTETDAPYLSPVKQVRNEPKNVVGTVTLLAQLRGWDEQRAKELVWNNYKTLFGLGE